MINLYDFPELEMLADLKIKAMHADKLKAKEFVRERLADEYVADTFGIWSDPAHIDWQLLPNSFVLKANHGWRFNTFIRNKAEIDIDEVNEKLARWLATDFSLVRNEPHYALIPRCIFAEEYLNNPINVVVYCYKEQPKWVSVFTTVKTISYENTYNTALELQTWTLSGLQISKELQFIDFDKCLQTASILCKGLKFVRIDLYQTQSKILFSEYTFSPFSGRIRTFPCPEYEQVFYDTLIA